MGRHAAVHRLVLRSGFLVLLLAGLSCATTTTELWPQAERIEIVMAEPDRSVCSYLADVQGSGKASDMGQATAYARVDLRNAASKVEADYVTIDTQIAGNAMDYTGRIQVVLTGRAFKCRQAAAASAPPGAIPVAPGDGAPASPGTAPSESP